MHKVARLDELREDRATRVKAGETPVMLVRAGQAVRAFSADCPHAGAPLEQGALCHGRIVCPWHKGTFDATDGRLIEPPALAALDRYEVRIEGGEVFVTPEPLERPKPESRGSGKTLFIAGAGAAGAAACTALREAGFEGRIVLAGRDARVPYDRTTLSKFVVAGDLKPDDVYPLFDPAFLEKERIERIESEVVRLDAAARRAELADGTAIDYEAALVCTGGVPLPLDVPGSNLAHVHVLRNLDDARSILVTLDDAKRVVIVGSGFIGLEVASCLVKRGIEVNVVAPGKVPFARQFGERIGDMFRRLHERNGVTFHMNAHVSSLRGGNAVREAMLDSGERLVADAVIAGTGIRPATSFITGLALGEDGGITVDPAMRAAPGLYAAGDVARFPLPVSGKAVRIEHWRVAQQHARVAALNMAGITRTYAGVPFFWTYHYGKRFDYLGHADKPGDIVIDGDPDAQDFIAYLLEGGRVSAVVACEREAVTARLAEAMREPLTLDAARDVVRAATA
jgi:NADPH-dependent 2,4-dienoyl-CoA reductase/sulfur reductase-like enzyme/nitrite reductase/ring-hydroxylating ferredoxin subunit